MRRPTGERSPLGARAMSVTLNEFTTEWRDTGQGTTLLCLHPLGQNARFFDSFAAALGTGWRVVSFDQRGHGAASATPVAKWAQFVDDAEAAVARIDGPLHLAGFSMGGSIAADLAIRMPDRFASLTLAATPIRGTDVFAERARAEAGGGIKAIEQETVARWFGNSTHTQAIAQARGTLHAMTPRGFDAAWQSFATFEGYDRKAVAQLPHTLLLSYANDLSTPPAVLDDIAEVLRAHGVDVTRRDVADAGHMGLLEQPEETAAVVGKFIEALA